jgi:hypothetical protein
MLELATATDGLVLVGEVGGEHLRSDGHQRWAASYDSEPLLSRRERSLTTSLAIAPSAPRAVIMCDALVVGGPPGLPIRSA